MHSGRIFSEHFGVPQEKPPNTLHIRFHFQSYGKAKGSSNTNDGLAETGEYQGINVILVALLLLEGYTKHLLLLTLQIT